MKKKVPAAILFFALIGFSATQIISTPTGAPAGVSGSPAEGNATCYQYGCHVGAPTTVTNIISTDIPPEGYTPRTIYNITVTVSGSGNKGFEISPQKANGDSSGTLILGAGTWITGAKYITHTSPKPTSNAVWTFKWKAPGAGSGPVTFYGAFAITRNTTKKQALTISEKGSVGVKEIKSISAVSFFSKPRD